MSELITPMSAWIISIKGHNVIASSRVNPFTHKTIIVSQVKGLISIIVI